MTQIPKAPLILGLAGLIPFVWGAATYLADPLAQWGARALGPRFVGPYVQLFYGSVILSFMSGVLWGFATKASGKQAATGYVLSVIPALWAFFMTGGGPNGSTTTIIYYLYLQDFEWMHYGYAAAIAWVMVSMTLASRRTTSEPLANPTTRPA